MEEKVVGKILAVGLVHKAFENRMEVHQRVIHSPPRSATRGLGLPKTAGQRAEPAHPSRGQDTMINP